MLPLSVELKRQIARRVLRLPPSMTQRLSRTRARALEPQVGWMLQLVERSGEPPLNELSVEEARRRTLESLTILDPKEKPLVAQVEDRTMALAGRSLAIRIYRASIGHTAAPALLYFHGGGFVINNIDTHDVVCRIFARTSNRVVVSVDYRLAPEHPFPAAVDDCLDSYRWIAANGSALGIDAAKIAVGGDSAGGNLATVICRLLRDAGEQLPDYQVLLYPATDQVGAYGSREEYSRGFLLTHALITWFVDHYLQGHDPRDPQVSPLHASDLRGLPPAYISTAGFDPLRDEGEAYAAKLRDAGVNVVLDRLEPLIHGYASLTDISPTARRAIVRAGNHLRPGF